MLVYNIHIIDFPTLPAHKTLYNKAPLFNALTLTNNVFFFYSESVTKHSCYSIY